MKLVINDFRLWVNLGCSDEERLHRQLVSIKIEITLLEKCSAMDSDKIDETICYATLIDVIQSKCENMKFNLIERLNKFMHELVNDFIYTNTKYKNTTIKISVSKLRIPVPGIHGDVTCIYEY